jgi:hypothetical protein
VDGSRHPDEGDPMDELTDRLQELHRRIDDLLVRL